MSDVVYFNTGVGRLVSGDVFRENDKDRNGNPLIIKNGANAGQPRTECSFGVAFSKQDPSWPAFEQQILSVARRAFPTHFNAQTGQPINPANMSLKIVDGDSTVMNTANKRPCDQVGYPGNWIVFFSNGSAPTCYTKGGVQHIIDTSSIKKGYFIRVSGSIKPNGNAQKPGVYINHSEVELYGYGEEISSKPAPTEIFGQDAAFVPEGMTAQPVAPQQNQQAQQQWAAHDAAPAPAQAPHTPAPPTHQTPAAQTPATPPPPAHDLVQNAGQQAPPAAPPAAQAGPQLTAKAGGFTYEQMIAKGWTDASLREHGYML